MLPSSFAQRFSQTDSRIASSVALQCFQAGVPSRLSAVREDLLWNRLHPLNRGKAVHPGCATMQDLYAAYEKRQMRTAVRLLVAKGHPLCWEGSLTFERCCTNAESSGVPSCWEGWDDSTALFTQETCCTTTSAEAAADSAHVPFEIPN